jgi:hypothetical protein
VVGDATLDLLIEQRGVDQTTGSIDDSTSAIRGRVDLTFVPDDELIPLTPDDLLAPYGNEIRVKRGITYADGSTELVGLGIFGIEEVTVDDTGDDISLRLIGLDRAQRVSRARFESPAFVNSGVSATESLLDVIQTVWPDVEYDIAGTSQTLPQLVAAEGDDRWAFCQSMATSLGMELFFDGDGVLILRPIPGGSAVATLGEGEALLGASRGWVREGTYNRVIATGENLGEGVAPARGVATDTDATSPTYYYGPFGTVPRFYSSPFLSTDAQAADAAAAILAQETGTTQIVSFAALVNPALEPGDVVRITRQRIGIDEDGLIEALTIPLDVEGEMTGRTRAVEVYG